MPPPTKTPSKLYEQLLEFFASAIFQMPVLNFIDQNCMIFCSEDDDNAEYREVHLQYKALVSALIGAFCEDAKMKYEDFINALSDFSDRAKGFEGTALKAVYEQVLAAENYSLFVNLMLRHNVELQQQCLLLILREIGNLPPSVIAAATGASVETLQALVASAQQGGAGAAASGGAVGKGGVKGSSGGKPTNPADQELAILMAVLKDSNINEQPSGGSAQPLPGKSSSSGQQSQQQAKSTGKQSSGPSSSPASQTSSGPSLPVASSGSTSSGKSSGGLGPLPPVPSKSGSLTASGGANEAETAEKVANLVDKMAGKKATYDKKVEQAMLNEPAPSGRGLAPAGLTGTSASGSSSLPPLPGAGGATGGRKTGLSEEQASLAAISAMLQPLAGSESSSSQHGDKTADMLKNPATVRALEALKNMNADDLVARSEYLKSQRDRLIALKQQQRKSLLDEEAKKQGSSRPKSARISKQLVDDEKAPASNLSPEDEEKMRIRRAIGESIKRELMASKPDK